MRTITLHNYTELDSVTRRYAIREYRYSAACDEHINYDLSEFWNCVNEFVEAVFESGSYRWDTHYCSSRISLRWVYMYRDYDIALDGFNPSYCYDMDMVGMWMRYAETLDALQNEYWRMYDHETFVDYLDMIEESYNSILKQFEGEFNAYVDMIVSYIIDPDDDQLLEWIDCDEAEFFENGRLYA